MCQFGEGDEEEKKLSENKKTQEQIEIAVREGQQLMTHETVCMQVLKEKKRNKKVTVKHLSKAADYLEIMNKKKKTCFSKLFKVNDASPTLALLYPLL